MSQFSKNYNNFLLKKLSLSSQKYGFGTRGSGKNQFQIPGSKRNRIPDPDSHHWFNQKICFRTYVDVLTGIRYIPFSIFVSTMISTHLGDCPVVLVGMLLMNEWPVPLAENHERVHRPPNAVRPPNRLLRRRRRGRRRTRGNILIVEYVFVREVHTWRFRNITLL